MIYIQRMAERVRLIGIIDALMNRFLWIKNDIGNKKPTREQRTNWDYMLDLIRDNLKQFNDLGGK